MLKMCPKLVSKLDFQLYRDLPRLQCSIGYGGQLEGWLSGKEIAKMDKQQWNYCVHMIFDEATLHMKG